MATIKPKTYTALVNAINKKVRVAIEDTCKELLSQLLVYIKTEYYEQYEPISYVRTYQFAESAVMNIVSDSCGEVFMDENLMDYKSIAYRWQDGKVVAIDPVDNWTGEKQITFAAQGYHGAPEIQTPGRYWESFIDYCNRNATNLLKKNLQKQGIKVK